MIASKKPSSDEVHGLSVRVADLALQVAESANSVGDLFTSSGSCAGLYALLIGCRTWVYRRAAAYVVVGTIDTTFNLERSSVGLNDGAITCRAGDGGGGCRAGRSLWQSGGWRKSRDYRGSDYLQSSAPNVAVDAGLSKAVLEVARTIGHV